MDNNRTEMGSRIRKLREAGGETQADIARALGVKRETVNQWENGARGLKPEYTAGLADYFGVSCDYILRGLQAENAQAHQTLGLSEDAMKRLAAHKEDAHFLKTVNRLLETEDGVQIIKTITYYLADGTRPENVPYPQGVNDRYKALLNTHMEIAYQGLNETRLVPYGALNEAYLMRVLTRLSKWKDALAENKEI